MSLKRTSIPFPEKALLPEVTPLEMEMIHKLATFCTRMDRHDFNRLSPQMKMAVSELIQRERQLQLKSITKRMAGKPFSWTAPRTLIIAIWAVCHNTTFLTDAERVILIQLTDPHK